MSESKQPRRTKVTCKGYCGSKFYKDELYEYNKKLYCSSCLDKQQIEDNYKILLYDYIKQCFSVYRVPTWHLSQIKNALEDGYTYKELYYGLKYSKEYLDVEFTPQSGLGYAINNIDNGMLFYTSLEDRQKTVEECWFGNEIIEPITINIEEPRNNNQYLESKIVNLEDLFNE